MQRGYSRSCLGVKAQLLSLFPKPAADLIFIYYQQFNEQGKYIRCDICHLDLIDQPQQLKVHLEGRKHCRRVIKGVNDRLLDYYYRTYGKLIKSEQRRLEVERNTICAFDEQMAEELLFADQEELQLQYVLELSERLR